MLTVMILLVSFLTNSVDNFLTLLNVNGVNNLLASCLGDLARVLMGMLVALLLFLAPVWGDTNCGGNTLPLELMDNTIVRQLEMVLPREIYKSFAHYYFGDHIEWEKLESYSIAAELEDHVEHMASSLHESFLKWVERGSKKPIEPFVYYPFFRSPRNVNNLWVSEVAFASVSAVLPTDQFNIFLNGGILSEEGGEHRYYRDREELQLLRDISVQYETTYGLINDTMKKKDEMKAMALMILELDIHPALACFYDQLAEKKTTVYKTLANNIPREKFLKYADKFLDELKKVLKSEKTEEQVTKWVNGMNNKIKTIDTNKLTSDAYLVFLRARSLVLGVDVEKVFEDLNEVYASIIKGLWLTKTGQWPAMVEFISNFYKHTFASKAFWQRVDVLYQEQVQISKRFYEDRKKSLESNINDEILPFFRGLLDFMVQLREGEKTFVDDYLADMEKVDLNEILGGYLNSLASILSRHFLSCYTALYGKPDFDLLAAAAEENSVVKAIKDLVFVNWPKDEILPKGFEEFVQKLVDGILLIVSSAYGACTDKMV